MLIAGFVGLGIFDYRRIEACTDAIGRAQLLRLSPMK